MINIKTRHLLEQLSKLDEMADNGQISNAEYITIGLLIKIYESLANMESRMKPYKSLEI